MDGKQPSRSSQSGRHFISGLGSGVASAVILQPLDLLKTRVQQQHHQRQQGHGSTSLPALLRQMRREPDFLSQLWRGTVPSVLRTGAGSALYFTTLNWLRQELSRYPAARQDGGRSASALTSTSMPAAGAAAAINSSGVGSSSSSSTSLPALTNTGNLVSGAAARTLCGLLLMPLTVIKVRFESDIYAYRSLGAAARGIYAVDGLRGFFAGFGATAMRDAPYAGMYVLFYEILKVRLARLVSRPATGTAATSAGHTRMQGGLAGSVNFTSAAIAATMCSAISNPFDAVKTRIQLQPKSYRNMGQAAMRMVREDGLRSFWNGLGLRMTRKVFSSALAWTLYEELIRRFESC